MVAPLLNIDIGTLYNARTQVLYFVIVCTILLRWDFTSLVTTDSFGTFFVKKKGIFEFKKATSGHVSSS
jgi:hypothetical protein